MIATPGPVLSEHDSAAEIQEAFGSMEVWESFHFMWVSNLTGF